MLSRAAIFSASEYGRKPLRVLVSDQRRASDFSRAQLRAENHANHSASCAAGEFRNCVRHEFLADHRILPARNPAPRRVGTCLCRDLWRERWNGRHAGWLAIKSVMPSRLLRLSLATILFAGMNAALSLVQAYAWSSMLWRNSRHASLAQTIAETFDGKRPCRYCLAVRKMASGPSIRAGLTTRVDFAYGTISPLDDALLRGFVDVAIKAEAAVTIPYPQAPPPRLTVSLTA